MPEPRSAGTTQQSGKAASDLFPSAMSASPKDAKMEFPAYLTFLFVSAAQAATPGPSTVFIVNNAIAYGWRRALAALSGDLVAIALLATASIIGLGALLMAYPVAFLALRLAGAAYIIWLGWSFLRPAAPQADPTGVEAVHRETGWGFGSTPLAWGSAIQRPSCFSQHCFRSFFRSGAEHPCSPFWLRPSSS
jgi:hypothetical protein